MGYANIRTQTSKSMYRKKSAELHKSRYFEVYKPANYGREDYCLDLKRKCIAKIQKPTIQAV